MTRACASCSRKFEAKRKTARFCSATCRKRGERATATEPTSLVDAVVLELSDAGRLATTSGQQALHLARQMVAPTQSGAAVAALSKQLSEVMDTALKGAHKAADPVDELRRKREQRAAG